MADCKEHLIIWDYKNVVLEEDTLHVFGNCDRCQREFMETWREPKYSIRDIKNGEIQEEWQNYEMLGTELMSP